MIMFLFIKNKIKKFLAYLKIMNAIIEKPTITRKELAEKTGLSESGIKWQLDKLKKERRIARNGGTYGGHWVVKDKGE